MVIGIMLNLIQKIEQKERVLLKYGNQLKHMKIKSGLGNITIQTLRKKSFGAKVVITLKNGKKITDQQDRADAHPYGSRPFKRQNYIKKFLALTENILEKQESDRFLKTVQKLKKLKPGQLNKLNIVVKRNKLKRNLKKGIF